jgi:hypothetical protein
MSPLLGIFAITLLSSILYNKFDANSRETTTRKNPYYSFEKSNAKSARRENFKDERQSSKFWNEKEDEAGFAFENINELDVCIFTVSEFFQIGGLKFLLLALQSKYCHPVTTQRSNVLLSCHCFENSSCHHVAD